MGSHEYHQRNLETVIWNPTTVAAAERERDTNLKIVAMELLYSRAIMSPLHTAVEK